MSSPERGGGAASAVPEGLEPLSHRRKRRRQLPLQGSAYSFTRAECACNISLKTNMEVNHTMVKIRLRRMGAKKAPYYRIVVADSRSPRDGRFIEELGTYDPMADGAKLKVDQERVQYWIANGAQPTDTVRGLLKKVEE